MGTVVDWIGEKREVGLRTLEGLKLPARKQEPWRYTDLSAMFNTDFGAPSSSAAAVREEDISRYWHEGTEGARLVLVDGVVSESLSDLSGLEAQGTGVTFGGLADPLLDGVGTPRHLTGGRGW